MAAGSMKYGKVSLTLLPFASRESGGKYTFCAVERKCTNRKIGKFEYFLTGKTKWHHRRNGGWKRKMENFIELSPNFINLFSKLIE